MWQDSVFRWIEWNIDHIAAHGVTPEEAESVVRNARPPYPKEIGDDRFNVVGRGSGGRLIQVGFIIDPDDTVFVIHARPLTQREKARERRHDRRRGRKK